MKKSTLIQITLSNEERKSLEEVEKLLCNLYQETPHDCKLECSTRDITIDELCNVQEFIYALVEGFTLLVVPEEED